MKKFYKEATAGTAPGGYVIRLDGKPVKTPLKNTLLLESRELAEAMAAEWDAQEGNIDPFSMPLTQLANTMIDKARGDDRPEMDKQLIEYGRSDLVCYFASHPRKLVKLHEKYWSPLVAWMKDKYDISLKTISGIQYIEQSEEEMNKMSDLIKGLDAVNFTVLQSAAATTGSVVIGLALLEGEISVEEAYHAACVDEIYQLDTWGADEEAQEKLDIIKSELKIIDLFKGLTKATS